MRLFVEDLRGKILGGATDWAWVVLIIVDFGEAKIGQPNITLFIDKNIFRFKAE